MFENLKKYKKKVAIDGEYIKKFTYEKLVDESNKLKRKVSSKSVCLLICSNSIESILGYIAFFNNEKTITILIDHSFKKNFIKTIIKKFKPNYIFAPRYLNFNKFKILDSIYNYSLFYRNFQIDKKINYKNFLLLPTSGTTQNPKFVRLSKFNLEDNSKKIINTLKIKSDHTTITTMPMGYSYGLSIINTHLLTGSKIIINNRSIFEKKFWEIINKKRVNSFGGVPQFYDLLKKIKFEKQNISSIKYLTQAGGKLEQDTLDYLEKIFLIKKINFFKMYGQTEASPRITILNSRNFFEKKGSVGKPLKGTIIELIDERGKKINKKNKVGEIMIRGNNVCLGYAKNFRDLFKSDINKKKLLTGDLAYIDKKNFVYITGRKKRMIKIFGIRMDVDDIESILKKNKITCICTSKNNKLVLKLDDLKLIEKSKDILSKHLDINKNYIVAELKEQKSLKTLL